LAELKRLLRLAKLASPQIEEIVNGCKNCVWIVSGWTELLQCVFCVFGSGDGVSPSATSLNMSLIMSTASQFPTSRQNANNLKDKMAAKAQSKSKKNMESVNTRLALVMKSGKYSLGYKSTLKSLRQGKGTFVYKRELTSV